MRNAGKSWRCRVSRCKVAIEADRIRPYARKFIKEADAEIDTPSGDFVKGRFFGFSAADLFDLLRLEGLHLHIEGQSYKLAFGRRRLKRETCQECQRLRREFDEAVQKTFRFEERLRHAKMRHDNEQAEALAGRLAYLADEQTRLGQALAEHMGQAHPGR